MANVNQILGTASPIIDFVLQYVKEHNRSNPNVVVPTKEEVVAHLRANADGLVAEIDTWERQHGF